MRHGELTLLRLAGIAVATFATVAACRPSLDEDLSHVDGPRVLAVRAEPPEARPNEPVRLSALYTDGTVAAPATPLAWSFCVARRAIAEPTAVAGDCLAGTEGSLVALGSAPEVQGIVPADACRLFGPERPPGKPGEPAGRAADPDGTGGYYQPGIVRAPGTGETLFEVRVRCGLAGATQEQVAAFEKTYHDNTNPALSDVVITRATGATTSVADGGEIVVAAGEELRVRASWPTCADDAAPCAGAERYPAFDTGARALVTRRESIRVSWLATRGHFADVRSGRDEDDLAQDVETTWTAPSDGGAGAGAAVVFVVVRDARGGTGLRSFRVRIGS